MRSRKEYIITKKEVQGEAGEALGSSVLKGRSVMIMRFPQHKITSPSR